MFILYGFAMEVSCWVMTIARTQAYMSPAESKFDEFAGSIFYVLGSSTVVQYYEGVGVFCEFDDIYRNVCFFTLLTLVVFSATSFLLV